MREALHAEGVGKSTGAVSLVWGLVWHTWISESVPGSGPKVYGLGFRALKPPRPKPLDALNPKLHLTSHNNVLNP